MKIRNITLALLPLIFSSFTYASALSEPTSYSKDLYTENILSGNYDNNIDKPDTFLDFGYGERVASPSQITNAILSWSNQ